MVDLVVNLAGCNLEALVAAVGPGDEVVVVVDIGDAAAGGRVDGQALEHVVGAVLLRVGAHHVVVANVDFVLRRRVGKRERALVGLGAVAVGLALVDGEVEVEPPLHLGPRGVVQEDAKLGLCRVVVDLTARTERRERCLLGRISKPRVEVVLIDGVGDGLLKPREAHRREVGHDAVERRGSRLRKVGVHGLGVVHVVPVRVVQKHAHRVRAVKAGAIVHLCAARERHEHLKKHRVECDDAVDVLALKRRPQLAPDVADTREIGDEAGIACNVADRVAVQLNFLVGQRHAGPLVVAGDVVVDGAHVAEHDGTVAHAHAAGLTGETAQGANLDVVEGHDDIHAVALGAQHVGQHVEQRRDLVHLAGKGRDLLFGLVDDLGKLGDVKLADAVDGVDRLGECGHDPLHRVDDRLKRRKVDLSLVILVFGNERVKRDAVEVLRQRNEGVLDKVAEHAYKRAGSFDVAANDRNELGGAPQGAFKLALEVFDLSGRLDRQIVSTGEIHALERVKSLIEQVRHTARLYLEVVDDPARHGRRGSPHNGNRRHTHAANDESAARMRLLA